jgi:hypothetical protein
LQNETSDEVWLYRDATPVDDYRWKLSARDYSNQPAFPRIDASLVSFAASKRYVSSHGSDSGGGLADGLWLFVHDNTECTAEYCCFRRLRR